MVFVVMFPSGELKYSFNILTNLYSLVTVYMYQTEIEFIYIVLLLTNIKICWVLSKDREHCPINFNVV